MGFENGSFGERGSVRSFPEDIANLDVRFCIPREELTEEAVSAFLIPRFRPVLERMSDVMLNGSWQWPTPICSPSAATQLVAAVQRRARRPDVLFLRGARNERAGNVLARIRADAIDHIRA